MAECANSLNIQEGSRYSFVFLKMWFAVSAGGPWTPKLQSFQPAVISGRDQKYKNAFRLHVFHRLSAEYTSGLLCYFSVD